MSRLLLSFIAKGGAYLVRWTCFSHPSPTLQFTTPTVFRAGSNKRPLCACLFLCVCEFVFLGGGGSLMKRITDLQPVTQLHAVGAQVRHAGLVVLDQERGAGGWHRLCLLHALVADIPRL